MEQPKTLPGKQHAASDRLDYLDAVRGICVILVVIAHHLVGADFVIKYPYLFSLTPFFLISGFLYAHKRSWEQPFRVVLAKNCKRLLYPFVTFSAVNLIWSVLYYKVVFPSAVPDFYSLREMLLLTVTTYGYNALWYMPCMFWGALLFTAVRKQKHHRLIWAACSIFIIVFYILFDEALSGHGLFSRVYCYLFRSVMAMIFVYAGHLLYYVLQSIDQQKERILLSFSIVISGINLGLLLIYPEQFPMANLAAHRLGNPYFYYLAAMAPSVSIFILCKRYWKDSRVLTYFGRHSLIVMALHMDIFVRIGWYILSKLQIQLGETGNSVLVIAMELAMAPVFIFIINRFFPFLLKLPQKNTKN
ncbi:MAG: acyltransferase [Oscillospiraceae bacterium]|nr:acyltransferase [Oscillospiraceae bacterium]